MIGVVFTEPTTPAWKSWRAKCDAAQVLLNNARGTGKVEKVSEALYKEQSDVYRDLSGPFHGKCAYCETLVAANHPGDLDHFRPKNRITSAAGVINITDDGGKECPHPGYYWLAYDWRNLLPACEDCNRPNKGRSSGVRVGKWDEFPVKDFRARNPGEEGKETPLLLNPTNENIKVDDHLTFGEAGVVEYLTPEGETTCNLFGLNLRQALVTERIAAYRRGYDAVLSYLISLGYGNDESAEPYETTLHNYKAGINPYSAAGRAGMHAMKKRLRLEDHPIFKDD